jgi:hypothetical protein
VFTIVRMNNTNVINEFNLDALNWDDDFELPPGKAADLTRPINRRQCCQAEVVQVKGGTWFLRWKERHPEMLPRFEYVTGEDSDEAKDRYYGNKIRDAFGGPDPADVWKNGALPVEWADAEREAEYKQLLRIMPFKDCELQLTRKEAFILVVACWMPAFSPELTKHDK